MKRKNLLQEYIQSSSDAKVLIAFSTIWTLESSLGFALNYCSSFLSQVTADALLLESNDTGKAILILISILNIINLVIGIKKPPYSW